MASGRDKRIQRDHQHLFLGRVRRSVVAGELAGITLELFRDEDMAEIEEGDEFVTVLLAVDPFASRPGG